MIHKIQTSENSYVDLEVKQQKSVLCLVISKGDVSLSFNQGETQQLNAIIQSIDAGNYTLKEYGTFKKGSEIYNSKAEVYKVSISAFRGIKSVQIRERLQSPTYSGFGKQGISLSVYKLKELQTHMKTIMQEFTDA